MKAFMITMILLAHLCAVQGFFAIGVPGLGGIDIGKHGVGVSAGGVRVGAGKNGLEAGVHMGAGVKVGKGGAYAGAGAKVYTGGLFPIPGKKPGAQAYYDVRAGDMEISAYCDANLSGDKPHCKTTSHPRLN